MESRIAFLFPGQGSQYVGMGLKAYQSYPFVREVFEAADDILGFKLSSLCFYGPTESLTDTLNAQAAILTVSMAYLRVHQSSTETAQPAFVAGHSMGEYTALVAAGALSFADGLRLVRERGRLMKEAGERNPGSMAAVIGMTVEALEAICREASGPTEMQSVRIANYNAPGQIVISGEEQAVNRAISLAKERGARRVVSLAVSIASHSPLMRSAADGLHTAVDAVTIKPAHVPIIANVTARPITTPDEIRQELVAQLTSPVRWIESVQYMAQQGVSTFVEIGPKDVLTGLQKRIAPEMAVINAESEKGFAQV